MPEVGAYLAPFASVFHNRQSWRTVERYVTGLLTDLPRKNCDTIAATVAGASIERLQHLLTDAAWDPLELDQARVRTLAAQSAAGGILVLDDTGLPKQGKASAGVARQYSGTLGKVGNCQVVVSAEYVEDDPSSSRPLHWPVSAHLYLSEAWVADEQRRQRAHIPEETTFQTKPALALDLVDRARAWAVPFATVVADAGYGDNPSFLAGLGGTPDPLCLCRGNHLRPAPARRRWRLRQGHRLGKVAASPRKRVRRRSTPRRRCWTGCPMRAWQPVCLRETATGHALWKQVVAIRVHRATGSARHSTSHQPGEHRTGRLVDRGATTARARLGDAKRYFSTLPADVAPARVLALAHARWVIERFYEDAKGECGLDDYQGRGWNGLHRHLALVMLAYSFLVSHRWSPNTGADGGFPPLNAPRQPARRPSRRPALALPGPRPLARRLRPNHYLPTSQNLTE